MEKKIILALFAIATFTCNDASAQSSKAPVAVTNGFSEKYPDAKNAAWQDQQTGFSVEFEENGKQYVSRFSNSGVWIITERVIIEDYLPTAIHKSFSKGPYARWEVKQVTIIKTPENDTQYKITVTKNDQNKKELLFNADGQLVKDNFTF